MVSSSELNIIFSVDNFSVSSSISKVKPVKLFLTIIPWSWILKNKEYVSLFGNLTIEKVRQLTVLLIISCLL